MGSIKGLSPSEVANLKAKPIKVIVYGPGRIKRNTQTRKYTKRVEIRKQLRKHFPNATVEFGEQAPIINVGRMPVGKIQMQLKQAKDADLVFIMDIGRGANFEADYFIPNYRWFREICYILVPKNYLKSSSFVKDELYSLLPKKQCIGYTKSQFYSCSLARKICVDIAMEVALRKYIDDI